MESRVRTRGTGSVLMPSRVSLMNRDGLIPMGVACPEVWDARKQCQAWGAPVYVHACKHEPGHKGGHLCPCGSRHKATQ